MLGAVLRTVSARRIIGGARRRMRVHGPVGLDVGVAGVRGSLGTSVRLDGRVLLLLRMRGGLLRDQMRFGQAMRRRMREGERRMRYQDAKRIEHGERGRRAPS